MLSSYVTLCNVTERQHADQTKGGRWPRWRRVLLAGVVLVLGCAILVWLSFWRVMSSVMERQSRQAEIVVTQIADHLYMLDATLGDRQLGASHVVSIGTEGVLFVDAPMTQALHDKVWAALEGIEPTVAERLLTVINTHAHPDHARGNAFWPPSTEIVAHRSTRDRLADSVRPFWFLPAVPPLRGSALPSATFERTHALERASETVQLLHVGAGHTDGDVVVFFERSRVVHLGDLFHGVGGHPAADWRNSGGDPRGLVEGLDAVLSRLPDDVRVVGGHGGVGQVWSREDLETYRNLVAEMTESVWSKIQSGHTQDEVLQEGVPQEWRWWFERARNDSVMHGPAEGWLENLFQALLHGERAAPTPAPRP